jgi:hypothetical protein
MKVIAIQLLKLQGLKMNVMIVSRTMPKNKTSKALKL